MSVKAPTLGNGLKIAPDATGRPTKKITLHKYQSMAFESKARFVCLSAGTGGGKTFMGPPWLCNEISKHPGDTWLILAPTYKILSRATMPTWIEFVRGTQYEGEYIEGRNVYNLPDGGTIFCMSTDNWKGIEGGQYQGAWLDEAGQMSHMAWIAVQARLGLKQGRCLFTTTPYANNWLNSEVVIRAKSGDPDYFVVQYASIGNPYYPKEEYERARRTLPPHLFEMRYNGNFTRIEGMVYPEFDECLVDDDPSALLEKARQLDWEIVGGIDWGFSDPFVALVGVLDPTTDTLYIVFERYVPRQTLQSHATVLLARGFGEDTVFFADPAGAQHIADMTAYGLALHPANNDIDLGIIAVTERIKTQRLRVCSRICHHTIDEASKYRYPNEEDTSALSTLHNEKPIDDNNHAMDAIRYLIRGLDGDSISDTAVTTYLTEEELEEVRQSQHGHTTSTDRYSQVDPNSDPSNEGLFDTAKGEGVEGEDDNDDPNREANMHDARVAVGIGDDEPWLTEDNPAVWRRR